MARTALGSWALTVLLLPLPSGALHDGPRVLQTPLERRLFFSTTGRPEEAKSSSGRMSCAAPQTAAVGSAIIGRSIRLTESDRDLDSHVGTPADCCAQPRRQELRALWPRRGRRGTGTDTRMARARVGVSSYEKPRVVQILLFVTHTPDANSGSMPERSGRSRGYGHRQRMEWPGRH